MRVIGGLWDWAWRWIGRIGAFWSAFNIVCPIAMGIWASHFREIPLPIIVTLAVMICAMLLLIRVAFLWAEHLSATSYPDAQHKGGEGFSVAHWQIQGPRGKDTLKLDADGTAKILTQDGQIAATGGWKYTEGQAFLWW